MNWDEFIDRYLNNNEEFTFKYKNLKIDLLYSSNGEKFVYYLSEYIENQNIIERIKNRKHFWESKEFTSTQELLDNFTIEGKKFKEIWNELEWK